MEYIACISQANYSYNTVTLCMQYSLFLVGCPMNGKTKF